MTQYFDLTKLFIRSLKINKFNKKGGRLFFYILVLLSLLFVFVPILFFYTFFVYNMMSKLNDVDYAVKGFEALLFIISIFSFVFSFNVILNELFFSEDIENLLPLPIKPETLVASKFTSCFLVENVILFIFLLLAVLAYVLALKLPIHYLLLSLFGIIFLPMISMVYCSIIIFFAINLLKNFLSTKTIKKIGFLFLGILVFLVFFLLWKLSSFNFEKYIEDFAAGDHTFLEVMKFIFPSVHFFALGLNSGSVFYIILSIFISLVYFCFMLFVAKYLYYDGVMGIFGKDTESKRSSSNKIKDFKVQKPIVNYFLKDLKILFRSPTFLINCIIINIIWPIFVFLIFKIAMPDYTIDFMRNAIINNNSNFYFRMLLLVIGISIIIPAFNSLSSSAFSREGKNFHFIKYIPMKYGLQWREKFLVSFIISLIGILIYSIPFFLIIHLPILNIVLYVILTILCISFVSFIGLLIDSAYPKLVWDDEADSLRENYNAFIAMGYSLLLFILLCGGGYYLIDKRSITLSQFTLISLIILIIGNILLYLISKKKISHNILNQEV